MANVKGLIPSPPGWQLENKVTGVKSAIPVWFLMEEDGDFWAEPGVTHDSVTFSHTWDDITYRVIEPS